MEMNPKQAKSARVRLGCVELRVAKRLHFAEANVLDWRSSRLSDAVFSLDSLMLIDDLPSLLNMAYMSLQPSGLLMVSVIVAGPCVDDELRRFVWDVDLPSHWLIYFTMADLDQSMARCIELGGQVIAGPRAMGDDGRFCVIRDVAGAVVPLNQSY